MTVDRWVRNVHAEGFVRLVSCMQPVEHFAEPQKETNWTGDLEVVRNARVSYNADWRTGESENSDTKLVHSMTRRGHTSPFEAMVFTFEVKAPIFVVRQWHRHRTWSYNELSARYTELDEGWYLPEPDKVGSQDPHEKQARNFGEPRAQDFEAVEIINGASRMAHSIYKSLLSAGVPRELARSVLPVNTYTRMFATVDLHNLKGFLRLRLDSHAQYEIRAYAEAVLELITPVVPVAVAAFKEELGHG